MSKRKERSRQEIRDSLFAKEDAEDIQQAKREAIRKERNKRRRAKLRAKNAKEQAERKVKKERFPMTDSGLPYSERVRLLAEYRKKYRLDAKGRRPGDEDYGLNA